MKPVTKEVKTLWAGRAWVHAKYLNLATRNKTPLVLNYKGDTMTIQPEDFRARFDRQKQVEDRFQSGVMHNQYGIVWKKDQPKHSHNNGEETCFECEVTRLNV